MCLKSEIKISMLSSAEKVEGQGVASAYREQVNLVKELPSKFTVIFDKILNMDIVHFHTIDLKHYLSIPLVKIKGATVGYVHFLPETIEGSLKLPEPVKYIFYKYIINFYRSMDYLVTVNPYFIEKLVECGISKEKIFYIPNFVSEELFYPLDSNQIKKEKKDLKLPSEKFIVLGVGQVQNRKGVMDFVNTARRLPEVQFIWVGGFSFGKISDGYKKLKKVVDNPPMNVRFTGIVPRNTMNIYFNIADLLFLPSYNELFPMSILEAMNCHTPLLLRDIPIYKDILNGYYLSAGSINGFIHIIKSLIFDKSYYNLARKKSMAGKEYYSREHVLEMWNEFYQKVYGEKVVGS
ncbi:MAG: glycosyltransferase family 4 protein [Halanaerobiaceae bacterium]